MGAWGGWALAPNIAMGRVLPLPHELVAEGRRTFKTIGDFFPLGERVFGKRAYRPAGRLLSPESDFSDAIVATGGSTDRMAGNSFCSEAFSPVLAVSLPVALIISLDSTDTATGVEASITACTAKASASPAPKRSSRPG